MAERDGSAIVCNNCKGTGRHVFIHEYEEPEDFKVRTDVKRVYRTNPGIIIGASKDNRVKLEDFGGMDYEAWLKLKNKNNFPARSEMRWYSCPAWWYQSADYNKKPNWDACIVCGSFSSCEHFGNKATCWERFDSENRNKKEK